MFVSDFISGIIALPLAIGFGIASNVTPTQGIRTAIIAGAGLRALNIMHQKFTRRGTHLIFSRLQPQRMKALYNSGFIDKLNLKNICADIDDSVNRAWEIVVSGEKLGALDSSLADGVH